MLHANDEPDGDEDATDFFQELSLHCSQRRPHSLPPRASRSDPSPEFARHGSACGQTSSAIDAIDVDARHLASGAFPVHTLSAATATHAAPASEVKRFHRGIFWAACFLSLLFMQHSRVLKTISFDLFLDILTSLIADQDCTISSQQALMERARRIHQVLYQLGLTPASSRHVLASEPFVASCFCAKPAPVIRAPCQSTQCDLRRADAGFASTVECPRARCQTGIRYFIAEN